MPERKRRTLQYAPADNTTEVRKAAAGNADAVILDLEGLVDESQKGDARDNLVGLVEETDFEGKETVVRINGLRSDAWLTDLMAALEAGVDTIRLPKIEEPWEVRTVVEATSQLTTSSPEFLLQLESPKGILNGHELAQVCRDLPAVTGIGIGIGDYTTSLGRDEHTAGMRSYLLNLTAAYATVGEMDPLAYVHKDLDTLRTAAEQARALGHVGQPITHTVRTDEFVSVLNDVYSE